LIFGNYKGGHMKRLALLILGLALALTLTAQTLEGENVAIRQGANIEWFRSSTAIDTGVVYIWSDTRTGGRDLYGQLISPTGQKLWGGDEGLLIDGKPDRQEDPMVITTSDGNIIVAWVDFSQDKDGDIYANKISPSGTKLWGTGGAGIVVCDATREQISINIVPDNAGGAYIAWSDSRTSVTQIYLQHLNSAGVATWAANGVNIDPTDHNKGSNTMWEDTTGGAVMAYVIQYGNTSETGVSYIRFDKTQTNAIVWGPMEIATQATPATQPQSNPKMSPDGTGGFIFVWETKDVGSTITRLKAQRINISGAKQWTDDGVNVTGEFSLTAIQENHRVVEVGSGGAIVAWEDKRGNNTDPYIYIQKLNLAGLQQWTSGGIPLYQATTTTQSNLRMTKTSDGGAAIVWEDSRNTDVSNRQIFVQRVQTGGSFAWTAGGVLVNDDTHGQLGGNIKQMGDDFAVVFADVNSLTTQLYSSAGSPILQANGIDVYSGLSGNADGLVLKTFGDRSFMFWDDTRYGNYGKKIYYQMVDDTGNPQLDVNGKRVGFDDLSTPSAEEKFYVEINDAGQMCVAWLKTIGAIKSVFAQVISPTGEKLLIAEGIELKQNGNSTEERPRVYWRNGGWEIYWSENGPSSTTAVYGQRIVGTTIAWGAEAKTIASEFIDYGGGIADGRSCTFLNACGDYIVFQHIGGAGLIFPYLDRYQILKIDDTGSPAAGWGEFGQTLTGLTALDESNIFLYEDNIVLIWTDRDPDPDNPIRRIMMTLLNANGTPIYENPIVNLTPNLNAITQINAYQHGNTFTITFKHQEQGYGGSWKNRTIRFSVSTDGISHLWNENGVPILPSDNIAGVSQNEVQTLKHGSNHASVWSMDPASATTEEPADDIYLTILDSDGQYTTNISTGFIVSDADKRQELPQLSANNGNTITVAFRDGRSSGKEPIYGIYMQKVTMPPSSIFGDTLPRPDKVLSAVNNYPNPFNPTTNIAFDLASEAMVSIDIYNIKGQLVRSLVRDKFEKGAHSVAWNGVNNADTPVGSGVYFYRINASGERLTRKMLLLK